LLNLLAYPFRLFFLSAGGFAACAVPLWVLFVTGADPLRVFPHWHPHEMLGGFLYPAVAGFLLTAVCNWTGSEPLRGARLLGLWILWLLPRLGFIAGMDDLWLHVLDLMFLPLVLLAAARPVIAVRQWRQLPLLAVLTALWLADLAFHVSHQPQWLYLALQIAALLLLLVGARITPAFSRNWLRAQGRDPAVVRDLIWLPPAMYSSFIALLLLDAARLLFDPTLFSAGQVLLASSSAVLIALRVVIWSPWAVRSEPLLWILHAGMLWVTVGLLLRTLALFGLQPDSSWHHALGAGALGTMILGVMARVALGHTGRPLLLPHGMLAAFALIIAAALLRILAAGGLLGWKVGILLSGVTWTMALLIFLWRYAGILLAPRPDGRPG
jgi:uncharacterized protein involved in response to NO